MDYRKNPKTKFRQVRRLSKDEAHAEIEALREGIEYHDYWYYVKNRPKIADTTYDRLFRRLQDLEAAFPQFAREDSPTRRVGAKPMDELKRVEHSAVMLSLHAVYEATEVEEFDRRVRRETDIGENAYVVEPKFDGLSVELVYENATLTRGATRGDGEAGEDASKSIKTIRSVPLHLRDDGQSPPSFLAVRGEVFIPRTAFQQLNKGRVQNGQEPFANPRNAAAGTIRQLDPNKVADIPLDIFFYEVLEVKSRSLESHWDMLGQLSTWGLKTDPHNQRYSDLKEIERYHDHLANERNDLEYEIDGIVIKINDYEVRQRLGTRQRSPRWALAWKFAPKQETTMLHDIVVQVGRTGMLTPVALLEPVNVGGVTVSRATLHNADEVERKDIRPGDKVRIERAGDVIPEVVERIPQRGKKRQGPFAMPRRCPACGAEVFREGVYYFCPTSLSCPGQLVGRLMHYASRAATDIAGLGDETARELVDKEIVKTIADLYRLSVDDLKQLGGFATKSAQQLYDAIQNTKNLRLDRFIYALGIRHVGEHLAQVLARHFPSIEALQEAEPDALQDIPEIGPESARSIHSFFQEEENKAVLRKLLEAGVTVKKMPAATGKGPLDGKTFVFTGELDKLTRDAAQRLVEDLGGRATTSVSGSTDFVVVGDNPGGKLDEARQRNIKTINEEEFDSLVSR